MKTKTLKKVSCVILTLTLLFIHSSTAMGQGILIIDSDYLLNNVFTLDPDDSGGDIELRFGESLGEYLKWDSINLTFKFSDDLDLEGNELKNFRIDNLAAEPTCDGTAIGRVYHNTTNNNSYICNGTSWEQINGGGTVSDTLAAVQARRTSNFTLINQNQWYDIPLDSTDIENDATVLEHNNISTERIDVKDEGLYRITYHLDASDNTTSHGIQAKLRLNNTSDIAGSFLESTNYQTEHHPLTASVLVNLNTGDYITLQAQRLSSNTVIGEPLITIVKLDGIKGEKGDPGSVGTGTDSESWIIDEDNTGGDLTLRFGQTLNKFLKWDSTNNEFDLNDDLNLNSNQFINARIQNTGIAPTTCDAASAGMQWYDTDTGIVYVCDHIREKWLSMSELVLYGDETGGCPAGADPNSNNSCNVDWGNGLGPDNSTDLGLYVPFPATIVGAGFSADDDACITGSFDVEIWTTGNNSDDNNYVLESELATGLNGQAHNANNLNIDIGGDQYILWGLDNNCGQTIDDFNIIVYFKWRHS